jgi:type VI protein secretion system component VasK
MMGDGGVRLLAVSAVVMGISHTIARERIFLPLRERLGGGGKERWLGSLVSCPYCVSHWVAFVLVPLMDVYPLRTPHAWGLLSSVLDWFFSSVLVAVIAAFLRIAFYFIDETQGLVRRQQRRVDVETAREESSPVSRRRARRFAHLRSHPARHLGLAARRS